MTTKPALNVERLRELYAMLIGLPTGQFDLNVWRRSVVKTGVSLLSTTKVTDRQLLENECGAVACAIGWACAYPPFKAEGLRFKIGRNLGLPSFKKGRSFQSSFRGVEKFFGLSSDEALWLFAPESYYRLDRTAKHVCARVLELLAQHRAITQERRAELIVKDQLPTDFNGRYTSPI